MLAGLPTLAQRYSSRTNAWDFIRISLTIGVLIAHSWPIGFGSPAVGLSYTDGQIDLGSLCVEGFFLVSGFLITASAMRLSWPRYIWCRLLRVFPGFWVCLLATAFVFGPVAALIESGTLAGYWTHPEGPFQYLLRNAATSMDQFVISGLLAHTPFGELTGGPSGFNGSLWTLRYELACYAAILLLSVTAVLRRARWAVLLLTAVFLLLTVRDMVVVGDVTYRPLEHHVIRVPVMGTYAYNSVLYFGFMFLLGSCFYLYRDRIPVHRVVAGLALVVLVASLAFGGVYTLGLPAYAYLLVYAAVTLPERFRRVGRRNDYSFGVYIYAFPIQQLLALAGANQFGPFAYLGLTMVITGGLAFLSWHLVERRFLALKDVQLPRRRTGLRPPPLTTVDRGELSTVRGMCSPMTSVAHAVPVHVSHDRLDMSGGLDCQTCRLGGSK